jgi:type II secretory pathway pseudopilin PulG
MVAILVAISLLGGGLLYVMFRWIRDEVRNRKIRRLIRTYRQARTVHL